MSKTDKLTQLYKKANALNDELPKDLIDKMAVYGQILELIGGLHASALKDWKLSEAKRREVLASAIVYGAELEGTEQAKTAKEREAAAEVIGAQARKEEALAEAEAQRWRNAYSSTSEMIQILKKKYEHLSNVAKGGI